MPKNPENMTREELLTRVRSQARKLAEARHEIDWRIRDEASVRHWAEEAWKEIRRLHVVLEHHWDVRQEALRIAGLPEEAREIELARFDYETRTWVPAHPELDELLAPRSTTPEDAE